MGWAYGTAEQAAEKLLYFSSLNFCGAIFAPMGRFSAGLRFLFRLSVPFSRPRETLRPHQAAAGMGISLRIRTRL